MASRFKGFLVQHRPIEHRKWGQLVGIAFFPLAVFNPQTDAHLTFLDMVASASSESRRNDRMQCPLLLLYLSLWSSYHQCSSSESMMQSSTLQQQAA